MRLFAIRLENADTLIISADDEQQALEQAGLTSQALAHASQQLKQIGVHRDHADLVLDGIGPQRYEIRELNHVHFHLSVSALGTFDLRGMDERTDDALLEGYPTMRDAHETLADRFPDELQIENHRTQYDALLRDAFSREKTRLMLPAEEANQP